MAKEAKRAEKAKKQERKARKERKARPSPKAKGKQRETPRVGKDSSTQSSSVGEASRVLGYESFEQTEEAVQEDADWAEATWNCMKTMIRLKDLVDERKKRTHYEMKQASATRMEPASAGVQPLSSLPNQPPLLPEKAGSQALPSSNIPLPRVHPPAHSRSATTLNRPPYRNPPSRSIIPLRPSNYSDYRPSMAPIMWTPGIHLSPIFPSYSIQSHPVLTALPLPPQPHLSTTPHFPAPVVKPPAASTSRSRARSIEVLDLCSPSPEPELAPPPPKISPSVLAKSFTSPASEISPIASPRAAKSVVPPQSNPKRSVESIKSPKLDLQSLTIPPVVQIAPQPLPPPKFPPLLHSPLVRTPLLQRTPPPPVLPSLPIKSKSSTAAEVALRAVKAREKMKERVSREEDLRMEEGIATETVGLSH